MTVVLPALLAAFVVLGGLWLVATANRLDRLHVRMDAAWAALESALNRRAVVARAAVSGLLPAPDSAVLRAAAEDAETAPGEEREPAENRLTELLAGIPQHEIPPALADELADAEQRVVIARRMYNDAVRDTLALRRRYQVRCFRLAGTAAQPDYFEIVEPHSDPDSTGSARYASACVVVVDEYDRVLLFPQCDTRASADQFWLPVGGRIMDDEDVLDAARRELDAVLDVAPARDQLAGPIWRRHVECQVEGQRYTGNEWFFLLRWEAADVRITETGGSSANTFPTHGFRWWTVEQLQHTAETVYPEQLVEFLEPLLNSGWDGQLRSIW